MSPTTGPSTVMLCYVTGAIWCAKAPAAIAPLGGRPHGWLFSPSSPSSGLPSPAGGATGRTRSVMPKFPHDDTPRRIVIAHGLSTLLLSGLSALAVIYAALSSLHQDVPVMTESRSSPDSSCLAPPGSGHCPAWRFTIQRHMTMHMAVVAIAAAIDFFGVAGSRLTYASVSHPLQPHPGVVGELLVSGPGTPGAASCGAQFARRAGDGTGTFFFSGLLVWLSAFGSESARSASAPARASLRCS